MILTREACFACVLPQFGIADYGLKNLTAIWNVFLMDCLAKRGTALFDAGEGKISLSFR
jgi:hypothetical protein